MKKHNKYSDQEIIEGIISHNSSVLTYLYQKNFRSIKKYIEDNNGTEIDAEDIFQDVLILIFEKLRSGNLVLTCSLSTYLFSVAKMQWLSILRQRKRRNTVVDEVDSFLDIDTELVEDLIKAEKKKLFITHFNELTKDCKKIILLFLKGYSIAEITGIMEYSSEQHTKNRRLRCKNTLINKIINNPRFKELANGTVRHDNQIPRW